MHALIETHRQQLLDLARLHGVGNLRVFGSMARGDAGDDSDVDLQAVWSVVVQDLPALSATLARMAEHRA